MALNIIELLAQEIELKRSAPSNLPTEVLNNDTMNWEELERQIKRLRIAVLDIFDVLSQGQPGLIEQILETIYASLIKRIVIPASLLNGGTVNVPNPLDSSAPWTITRTLNTYRIGVPGAKIVQLSNITGEIQYTDITISTAYIDVSFDNEITEDKVVTII